MPSPPSSLLDKNNNHDENEKIRAAIQKFRNILQRSRYSNKNVQKLFGIPPRNISSDEFKLEKDMDMTSITKETMLSFAQSPIYIKPVTAGTQSTLASLLDDILNAQTNRIDESNDLYHKEEDYDPSLKCFVSLFLLGFAGT